MTIEQRTFVSPKDIAGVELECPNCHAKVLTTIKDFSHVVKQCPNCQQLVISDKHFPDSSKPSDQEAMVNFIVALKDIQERIANSGKDRLPLRIEIAEPQSGESALRTALGEE